jgi:acetyltransferase-like isoleucine patch superfamily enzyme
MSSEERRKILQMVEENKISAEEAASLMRALDEDAVEEQIDVYETESSSSFEGSEASAYEFDQVKARARRFVMIPLWIGVAIAVLSAWGIYTIQQNAGVNFWFFFLMLPLMFGVLLIALGAVGQGSKWLYINVDRRYATDWPKKITFGFPLPLGFRINEHWMREGVTMVDPTTTYIDVSVQLEPDVRILPNTTLSGSTTVRGGSVLGPDCQLGDTIVGADAGVRQTGARDAIVDDGVAVGRYVSLRPGTHLAAGAHVGTFVEIKNSEIGAGAKVPHLSYVGDADVGEGANVGAGNITANYDGRAKHRTRIGRNVRTGSNTVLVAPVEVGDGAYTGAGAVVTRDVPPGALAKGIPAKVDEGWVQRRENAGDDTEPTEG